MAHRADLESHACWAEPAWYHSSVLIAPLPSSLPTLCKRNGVGRVLGVWGKGPCAIARPATWRRLSAAHLQRVSPHTRFKVRGRTVPHEADQEGYGKDCIRRPHLGYWCNWGWTKQTPAGCTCFPAGAWGCNICLPLLSGVLQCSHGVQEETNSSVSLARPRLPLQRHCGYMPPKCSHTK